MSKGQRRKGQMRINTWIGANEHAWLAAAAEREAMSLTVYLRFMIRRQMVLEEKERELHALNNKVAGEVDP